jgi:ATP-dependent helicase/nuclease subunit A
VAAGAGSGKTATLVERFLRGAIDAGARAVLAVTFTEKAAGELRSRLQAQIAERLAEAHAEDDPLAPGDESGIAMWADLQDDLPNTQIGTIHALAASMLREHGAEIGVDPAFEVLDPAEAARLREETVADLLEGWARAHDLGDLREHVVRLADLWGRAKLGRMLVERLVERPRTVRWLDELEQNPTSASLLATWNVRYGIATDQALATMIAQMPASDLARHAAAAVRGLGDPTLRSQCRRLASLGADLVAAQDGRMRPAVALARNATILFKSDGGVRRRFPLGQIKRDWMPFRIDRRPLDDALQACLNAAEGRLPRGEIDAGLGHSTLADAVVSAAALTRVALVAHERRTVREGRLDFDDLLLQAVRLIERDGPARRSLRSRYRHVLVDEMQDTDPLQWRLLKALVADDGTEGSTARRLFVVGDKKQSIYAFRGADVTLFDEAEAWVWQANAALTGDPLGGVHELAENRRTLPELLAGLNALFERVLALDPNADVSAHVYEARPQSLACARTLPAQRVPGTMTLLAVPGGPPEPRPAPTDDSVDDNDETEPASAEVVSIDAVLSEADAIAAHLLRLRDAGASGRAEGLVLRVDPATRGERLRPFRFNDAALLLRRRTHLKLYEDALRRHGVPFVVTGGLGFYDTEEIVDLTNLLRVLRDPRDGLAAAGFLRSPLATLSDDGLACLALARVRAPLAQRVLSLGQAGGEGEALLASLPPDDRATARTAGALLSWLTDRVDRIPLADLLHGALDRSGAWVAYASGLRGPQAVANLRRLLDDAEAFEARGGGGVARFTEHLLRAADRQDATAEAPASTESSAGVAVCTVHAAKGLEWPVVVIPELEADASGEQPPVRLEEIRGGDGHRAVELTFRLPAEDPAARGDLVPALHRLATAEAERRRRAEEKRLFYVACTRARDHLVLGATVPVREGRLAVRPHTRLSWVLSAIGLAAATWEDLAGQPERPIGLDPDAPRLRILTGDHAGSDQRPEPFAAPAAMPSINRQEIADWLGEPPLGPRGTVGPLDVLVRPSRLPAFDACPIKLHLSERLGIDELALFSEESSPTARLRTSMGKVVHRVLELEIDPGTEPATEAFRQRVAALAREQAVPEGATDRAVAVARIAAERCLGPSGLLAQWQPNRSRTLREVPFELGLDLPGGGTARLVGAIDRLIIREGGPPVVVDYKIGGDEKSYDLQLSAYALAAATHLHAASVETLTINTTTGACHGRVLQATDLKVVRETIVDAALAIAAPGPTHVRVPSVPPCAQCGYAKASLCPIPSTRPAASSRETSARETSAREKSDG